MNRFALGALLISSLLSMASAPAFAAETSDTGCNVFVHTVNRTQGAASYLTFYVLVKDSYLKANSITQAGVHFQPGNLQPWVDYTAEAGERPQDDGTYTTIMLDVTLGDFADSSAFQAVGFAQNNGGDRFYDHNNANNLTFDSANNWFIRDTGVCGK